MPTPRADVGAAEDTSVPRAAILQRLRAAPEPLTVQELADVLDLHPNSVRFHLARLARHGLVSETRARPTGPGRPRLVYSVADSAEIAATGHQFLATALAEQIVRSIPDPGELAIEAGRHQGRRLVHRDPAAPPAAADEGKALMTALMREQGFGPEWDADGRRLWLHTCPFRPESDERPTVVCRVHLGLMRGALDAVDAPLEVTDLKSSPANPPCLAVFASRRPGGVG
jgi:predicted ArsR family transcriptional regulator